MHQRKICILLIPAILLTSSLSGCGILAVSGGVSGATSAASRGAQSPDDPCKNSSGTGYSISSRIEKTNEKILVWEVPDSSKLSATFGIANLSFNTSPITKIPDLYITVFGKVKSIEYEASADKIIEEKIYDAKPVGTLLGTTILLGLPLIFSPTKTLDNAFGCSEKLSSKLVPNQNDRVPTGNERWVDYSPNIARLQIIIPEKAPVEQELKVTNGTAWFRLDDHISLKNAKGQVNIKVLCLTCTNLNIDGVGVTYVDNKEIILDINQVRLAEASNKKKLEDIAKAAKLKAEEDRAKSLAEKVTIQPLNTPQPENTNNQTSAAIVEAKKKCSDLGFKAGTEGFGKCVLQLSR